MKDTLVSKLLCFLLLLAVACEFELPPEPSLPSDWEVKLLFPFYKGRYTLSDLFEGSGVVPDSSGGLKYFREDSIDVGAFSDSFWVVYVSPLRDSFIVGDAEIWYYGDTAWVVRDYFLSVSKEKSGIKKGILVDDSIGCNNVSFVINFGVPVGDSILVKVVGGNIRSETGDSVIYRYVVGEGVSVDSFIVSLAGDSVYSSSGDGYLDYIHLKLLFGIRYLPPEVHNVLITTCIICKPLNFEWFRGSVATQDTFVTSFVRSSPDPDRVVEFRDLEAYLLIYGDLEDVSVVRVNTFGIEQGWRRISERYYDASDTVNLEIDSLVGMLPDSLGFVVNLFSREGVFYRNETVPCLPVGLKFVIDVPFHFVIRDTLSVIGGKVSVFEIGDSTTREEVLEKQVGARLEFSLRNNSPLVGRVIMLHSNADISKWDSLFVVGREFQEGDSVFVDTIAVVKLDSAVSFSRYFIDSVKTGRLFLGCKHYILPSFVFFPDSGSVELNVSQGIDISSYLRIFLNPDEIVR